MAEAESSYRYLGSGAELALEVVGPSVEACLARAVEGVSGAFADVHPSVATSPHMLHLWALTPSDLLRAVLDSVLELAGDGRWAVGFEGSVTAKNRLQGHLEAVSFSTARPVRPLPTAMSWHDLTLAPTNGHWHGRVVAALD